MLKTIASTCVLRLQHGVTHVDLASV